MVRAAALFLVFAVGLGAIVPLTDYSVEASAEKPQKSRKNRKKYKKYSKQWWRAYHKRVKRQRELAARRRALRLRQIRLANAQKNAENNAANPVNSGSVVSPLVQAVSKSAKRGATSPQKDTQVRGGAGIGTNFGSASVTVVSPAVSADDNLRSKTVGGVATSSLRRTVIDQMLREEGWVVNDYQKEVGGRKVFVVVAQSASKSGVVQSHLFYFTEADGQIYRVATSTPDKNLARIEQESERIIATLRRKTDVQQAELKP